jgi:hypothetical protein
MVIKKNQSQRMVIRINKTKPNLADKVIQESLNWQTKNHSLFCLAALGFELRASSLLHKCSPLELLSSLFLCWVFLRSSLMNYLLGAGFEP